MLKVKPFLQTTNYCGPASLKMVMQYYGVNKSESELGRNIVDIDKKGTTGEEMLAVANKHGFVGFIKDFATLDDIKYEITINKRPVIVDWWSLTDGHYAVVVAIGEKYIYLQDPEYKSVRRLLLNDFRRIWFDFKGDFLEEKKDMIIRRMITVYPKNGHTK